MRAASRALLVVDDNEDNRYTLTRRLQREGYTNVTAAVDGEQALAFLRERPFDLVLLDVMMPRLNGYEVLERVHADPRLRHIPVIMISALDEVESVIRCIELGAEDYLSKPFNPTLLRARVGASLEKKRLRDEIAEVLERMEGELSRHAQSSSAWSRPISSFRVRQARSKYSPRSSRLGRSVAISTISSGARTAGFTSSSPTSRTRERRRRFSWRAPRP